MLDVDLADELAELVGQLRGQLLHHHAAGTWAAPGGPTSRPAGAGPSDPEHPTAQPALGTGSGFTGTASIAALATGAPVEPIDDDSHVVRTPLGRRSLAQIRAELGDCQRCKLCSGRKNIVFGVGDPNAELVFVGEGPGANEDAQGIPFVGEAGELLTKMIGAMGFTRDQVYICNVVKCRPPGNRNPEPDEIEACEPFLKAQLAAIRPKAIVALGKFAAQTLLRDTTAISRLRGKWREYEGIRLMPTFHPAYLLRNPAEKRAVWSDLQQVMALFGKAKR